jgi:hypothetical protein
MQHIKQSMRVLNRNGTGKIKDVWNVFLSIRVKMQSPWGCDAFSL